MIRTGKWFNVKSVTDGITVIVQDSTKTVQKNCFIAKHAYSEVQKHYDNVHAMINDC